MYMLIMGGSAVPHGTQSIHRGGKETRRVSVRRAAGLGTLQLQPQALAAPLNRLPKNQVPRRGLHRTTVENPLHLHPSTWRGRLQTQNDIADPSTVGHGGHSHVHTGAALGGNDVYGSPA